MLSPLEFVQGQLWRYRQSGNELVIETCPLCNKGDWKFYINANTGLWSCKHGKCQREGNIFSLKKALGLSIGVDPAGAGDALVELGESLYEQVRVAHEFLMSNAMYKATLMDEWSISEEAIRRHRLGVHFKVEDGIELKYVTIPHMVDDVLYNIKYRSWFDQAKRFHRVKDASSVIFNEDLLRRKPKMVVLCEGEKDCIVLQDRGFANCVGMTGGAGTLLPRWFDLLEPVEHIYLAYDADAAGEKGMAKVLPRLGLHRCKLIKLPPGYDIADFLKEREINDFYELLRAAQTPANPYISSAADVCDDAMRDDDKRIIPTPSANMNRILNGGLRVNTMTTMSAPPKIGKTTLALKVGEYAASVLGIPTLVYCMEMPKVDLLKMCVASRFGTGRRVQYKDIWAFKQEFTSPLYFGYAGSVTPDVLVETFKDAHVRYGVELVIFDNVHYLVRSADNTAERMSVAVKTLKSFTLDVPVALVAIAQPKKIDLKKGKDTNYYDIAWSSAFASDSDVIVLLHRDRSADDDRSFSPNMLVKVDAGRYTKGGRTYLEYIEDDVTFRDMTDAEIRAITAGDSE